MAKIVKRGFDRPSTEAVKAAAMSALAGPRMMKTNRVAQALPQGPRRRYRASVASVSFLSAVDSVRR